MHGILFSDDDNIIDRSNSSTWLSKGNNSPQQEGMLCKLQDRNLYFGGASVKCPNCGKATKTVQHLATMCGAMLQRFYKTRHDEVVRCLHFQFTKKYGLNKNKKLKNYEVKEVLSNERVTIKSDIPVLTELRLKFNKPDLLIHDWRTKEITLVEVGITNKNSLAATELEKLSKYEILGNELKCLYPGTNVTIIPVVMTWDGLVTRHFKRYMQQLQVKKRLQAYMQTMVLKKTCESILADYRNGCEWLEEEVSELMDQVETNPTDPDDIVL